MPTGQQIEELQTVLCLCAGEEWHTLGDGGCTSKVKPATYTSWKPSPDYWRNYKPYPVAGIFAELARLTPDRGAAKRYRSQAATIRYAAKY